MSRLFAIVERREAAGVRHLEIEDPSRATGLVEQVFGQVRSEYLLAAPVILHSLQPQLLRGFWSAFRETLLVGSLSRASKEVIAVEVARLNRCPYCEEAHSLSLDVIDGITGEPDPTNRDEIARWCEATRTPDSRLLSNPPFAPHELPEALGLLLVFHYLNRMVSTFCPQSVVPLPSFMRGLRSPMKRVIRLFMRSRIDRSVGPDDSPIGGQIPSELDWAKTHPSLAHSLLRWFEALDEVELPASVQSTVESELERWQGEDVPLVSFWPDPLVDHLEAQERGLASFALRIARCPYRITDDDLMALREQGVQDAELLSAAAWSAASAARRIVSWSRPI